MKPFFSLFLILLVNSEVVAQVSLFQRAIGGIEGCVDMQLTKDRGHIITGTTGGFGTNGVGNVYLLKTDTAGKIQWSKTYGGTLWDYGFSVKETNDDGYIIAGTTYSFGTSHSDAYLIKTDNAGNLIWSQTYGTADWEGATSICQTNDSGYIVTGNYTPAGGTNNDIYLFRTNASGDLLWAKFFSGTDYEEGTFILQTPDMGFLIAGNTYSFGTGNKDGILIKTDGLGNLLWSKTYGSAGDEDFQSCQPVNDGGFIISGYTDNHLGEDDGLMVKTDSAGNLQWSKKYGTIKWDRASWAEQTLDDGFILSGTTASTVGMNTNGYLIKTDYNGDLIWSRRYDLLRSSYFSLVHQENNGGYVTGGGILFPYDSQEVFHLYFSRFDSSGNSNCFQGTFDTVSTGFITSVTNPIPSTADSIGISTAIVSTVDISAIVVTNLCLSEGINEPIAAQSNTFLIFPNPISDYLYIETTKSEFIKTDVVITDVTGRVVVSEKNVVFDNQRHTINTASLINGIYFIKLTDNKGQILSTKFVKL